MDQYHKLLLTICSLLLLNAFKVQSQVVPNSTFDGIYYYLTLNNNQIKNKNHSKVAFQMNLFIQNKSSDSIVINNFNKNIYHISEINFRANENNEKRAFFWSLLTLSNEEPKDILMISPNVLISKRKK